MTAVVDVLYDDRRRCGERNALILSAVTISGSAIQIPEYHTVYRPVHWNGLHGITADSITQAAETRQVVAEV
jgi:hypothetical protein